MHICLPPICSSHPHTHTHHRLSQNNSCVREFNFILYPPHHLHLLRHRHPLFSLLALMLEKCEQATQGYVSSSSTTTTTTTTTTSTSNGTPNGNNCDGDSFSRDIQAFVQLLEKEKRPLLTNNAELDGLVSAMHGAICAMCFAMPQNAFYRT